MINERNPSRNDYNTKLADYLRQQGWLINDNGSSLEVRCPNESKHSKTAKPGDTVFTFADCGTPERFRCKRCDHSGVKGNANKLYASDFLRATGWIEPAFTAIPRPIEATEQ